MAHLNVPFSLDVGSDSWSSDIRQCLEQVYVVNANEAFKVNVKFGYVLLDQETGQYRYFAPSTNSYFMDSPARIDRPSDWQSFLERFDTNAVVDFVMKNRPNTKWTPVMVTNLMVDIAYLGISMGMGTLPDYIRNSHCIVSLDVHRSATNHNSRPYSDTRCALRALAFHRGRQTGGNGYDQLEARTHTMCAAWGKEGLSLKDVPEFEQRFEIAVDIFSLGEDGSVIPQFLSRTAYPDKMVLNLHDQHLSYMSNVPAYL